MDSVEQKILESANEFFFRYGYKKTSIDEIAAEAGIGKGTVYLHFSSKEELFFKCTQWKREQMISAVQGQLEGIERADELMKVRFKLEIREARKKLTQYAPSRAVILELMDNYHGIEACNTKDKQILKEQLIAGVEQGVFRPMDVDAQVAILSMIMRQMASRWITSDEETFESEYDGVMELILRGLCQ